MSIEEHRVYYVALSRAKNQLYVNVPELNVENVRLLNYFEVIVLKSQDEALEKQVVN